MDGEAARVIDFTKSSNTNANTPTKKRKSVSAEVTKKAPKKKKQKSIEVEAEGTVQTFFSLTLQGPTEGFSTALNTILSKEVDGNVSNPILVPPDLATELNDYFWRIFRESCLCILYLLSSSPTNLSQVVILSSCHVNACCIEFIRRSYLNVCRFQSCLEFIKLIWREKKIKQKKRGNEHSLKSESY